MSWRPVESKAAVESSVPEGLNRGISGARVIDRGRGRWSDRRMAIFGRHRIKNPVDGHAEIIECWLKPSVGSNSGAGAGNCRMTLRLDDVPGVPQQDIPYHELNMVENRWPEVGMRVAVTVDADHPDRAKVHWESVFGEIYGGKAGRAAEYLASAVNIDLDLSKGVEEPGPKPLASSNKEREAMIADLNGQFARGEITYEEMADGIKRVLGVPD
jgi:hypothetical protein